MKYVHLYLLVVIILVESCSKSNENDNNPSPQTPVKDSTKVSFTLEQIGLSDMFDVFTQTTPSVRISKGKPNRPFSYELTGSNGLKKATDTVIKGTGTLSGSGSADLYFPGLAHYKDGEITIKITLNNPDTTIIAKTQKAEYKIRSYKDFIRIGFYIHGDTSAHYVQTQDFAFPDTVFTRSPCGSYLYGSYDGQGYKITNLSIKATEAAAGSLPDLGLFMAADSGSVLKNIRLELSAQGITSSVDVNAGALVGRIWGSMIINCSVKGKIQVPANGLYATTGGITGFAQKTNIIGCSFRGNITGHTAGGIVGVAGGSSVIDMCYAYTSFEGVYTGGIIGSRTDNVNIANSYAVASTYPASFLAIAPELKDVIVVSNCYANAGTTQNGVTIAALPNMNASLAALEITVNWPQWVPRPSNNKPYKYDTDNSAPMKLWWE